METIVANSRGAEESGLLIGRRGDPFNDIASGRDPALPDGLFVFFRPLAKMEAPARLIITS